MFGAIQRMSKLPCTGHNTPGGGTMASQDVAALDDDVVDEIAEILFNEADSCLVTLNHGSDPESRQVHMKLKAKIESMSKDDPKFHPMKAEFLRGLRDMLGTNKRVENYLRNAPGELITKGTIEAYVSRADLLRAIERKVSGDKNKRWMMPTSCLLYTSPSPRDS